MAAEAAKNTNIFICGQNVCWGKEGALTDEVSATMLAEAGCGYVIALEAGLSLLSAWEKPLKNVITGLRRKPFAANSAAVQVP